MNLHPGQILEASDPIVGDAIRIVVTSVAADGSVHSRTIAHRGTSSPWEVRLGQDGPWDLTKHEWREAR